MPLSRLIVLILNAHPSAPSRSLGLGRQALERPVIVQDLSGRRAVKPAGSLLNDRLRKGSQTNPFFTMSKTDTARHPLGIRPKSWSVAGQVGGARRDRTDDLLLAKQALSQLSYGPLKGQTMVGLGRFELPTSRLSSARSNQLSYRPDKLPLMRPRKEKRRRRCPAKVSGARYQVSRHRTQATAPIVLSSGIDVQAARF